MNDLVLTNEIVTKFGDRDVRINSEKVNLVDVAKCCGLTKTNGNSKEYVRWNDGKGVIKKLQIIRGTDVPQEIKEEIDNVIEEIEESDDRNSIYISKWLAKRIATECHSQTAMEFKSWLVTLDCAREENLVEYVNVNEVKKYIDMTAVKITETFAPIIAELQRQSSKVQEQNTELTKLLLEQSSVNSKNIEDMKKLVGMKPKNTNQIGKILISKEKEYYGSQVKNFNYTFPEHIDNKNNLCSHFGVTALCNIHIDKFEEVVKYIDTMELVPLYSKKVFK